MRTCTFWMQTTSNLNRALLNLKLSYLTFMAYISVGRCRNATLEEFTVDRQPAARQMVREQVMQETP